MKVKNYLIVCTVLTSFWFTSTVFADSQETFVRKVKGGGSISQSIQTTDGNYAYLNGSRITKLRSVSGKNISQTTLSFDISSYANVRLRGIAQTSNGLVLVGDTDDWYYGNNSAIVIKVNSKGRVEWSKNIVVTGDIGFDSVTPTTDGGFIVTGRYYPVDEHPVLVKYNSRGEVVWSKHFDSLSWSFQSTPTLDGGVILAADLIQIDGRFIGVKVLKINGSGDLAWAATLEMKDFSLQSLTSLSDQRYVLAGKGDSSKVLLVNLNSDGTIHSKAAYSLNVPDFSISSLVGTPDKGIAIGGVLKKKSGSAYDGFLLKINERQKLTLQKRLGFPDSKETISTVIAKEDGSFLLFGSTDTATLFVGISSDGSVTGCTFSHNLIASKVLFGSLKHQDLSITPHDLFLPYGGTLNVKIKHLTLPISNACAN
jgi:hypothetical protein